MPNFSKLISVFSLTLIILVAVSNALAQKGAEFVVSGQAALEAKKYDAAIADLTKALKKDKNNPDAYALRGDAYLLSKRTDLSRLDYSQAIKLAPTNAAFYWKRALSYKDAPGDSRDLYFTNIAKAIELDAKNTEYLWDRGIAYGAMYNAEGYEKSRQDMEAALAAGGTDPRFYNQLGFIYEHLGPIEKAIENYSKYISLVPTDHFGYSSRARLYQVNKRYDLAIVDYTKVIELLPASGEGYYDRGNAYLQADDLDNAVKNYNAGIEMETTKDRGYGLRAFAYEYNKKYELALADYSKAAETFSGDDRYTSAEKRVRGILYPPRPEPVVSSAPASNSSASTSSDGDFGSKLAEAINNASGLVKDATDNIRQAINRRNQGADKGNVCVYVGRAIDNINTARITIDQATGRYPMQYIEEINKVRAMITSMRRETLQFHCG